jgi:hypothetical protein
MGLLYLFAFTFVLKGFVIIRLGFLFYLVQKITFTPRLSWVYYLSHQSQAFLFFHPKRSKSNVSVKDTFSLGHL